MTGTEVDVKHAVGVRFLDRTVPSGLVTVDVVPEAFGLVALETAAAGKPIIASRTGGWPDVAADGETGLLVPPGDGEVLRRALERVLADGDLRDRMGEAAKRKAKAFAADSVVPLFEQGYGLAQKVRRVRVPPAA